MQVSLCSTESTNEMALRTLDWPEFAAMFEAPLVRAVKKGTPCWAPCTFRGNKRAKLGVLRVDLLTYDFDDLTPESFESIMGALDRSGKVALVHSSYSHTAAKPKIRVILPLSRPATYEEFPAVWATALKGLGIEAQPDEACKDHSRLYYRYCRRPDATDFLSGTTDGTGLLDLDEVLEAAARAKHAPTPARVPVTMLDTVVADAESAENYLVNAEGGYNMDLLRQAVRRMSGEGAQYARQCVAGEALAPEGQRDRALCSFTFSLLKQLPPGTSHDALIALLEPSLAQWGPSDSGKTWEAKARKMLATAAPKVEAGRMEERNMADFVLRGMRRDSAATAGPAPEGVDPEEYAASLSEPYSQAQLATWYAEQGCSDDLSFKNRWVLLEGEQYIVFSEGAYKLPITERAFENSVHRDLSRAPVELFTKDKSGAMVPRPVNKIKMDYMTVARKSSASFSLQKSYYDPAEQEFCEAVCPNIKYKPVYHAKVQKWLELLGGPKKEKLLDWVASVTNLDYQSAALYLSGPPGVGKSLLAGGLAAIWGAPACSDLRDMMASSSFNEGVLGCPLLFSDEQLPAGEGVTSDLRKIIGNSSHQLNRKFRKPVTIKGCLRVMISGNNDHLLNRGEELTAYDQAAIDERFLVIRSDGKAHRYLLDIGGPSVVDTFRTRGLIAEHSLWLRSTRDIKPTERFLVSGGDGEFKAQLALGGKISAQISEWIVRWMMKPINLKSVNPHLWLGNGEVWVNPQAMADEGSWDGVIQSSKVPSAGEIATALRNMGVGCLDVKLSTGAHTRFFRLPQGLMEVKINQLSLGDIPLMLEKIAAPNEIMKTALDSAPKSEDN